MLFVQEVGGNYLGTLFLCSRGWIPGDLCSQPVLGMWSQALTCGLSSSSVPVFPPPPVPRVVAVSPQMRLVEDNPSSLSLVEIYKQRCAKKGIEHDNPISRYYDRLATVQARGTQASHQVWGRGWGPVGVLRLNARLSCGSAAMMGA